MKNKILALVCAAAIFFPLQKVRADIVYDCAPDENEDHFVWDLMADLETPDDEDCATLARAMLDDDGTVPEGDRNEITTASCNGLAQMASDMASGREENGEDTIETNLADFDNWHTVQGLYFQHFTDGVVDGRISFSEAIDFMSYDFIMFLENFGDNMESSTGYISLDADTVGGFADYGATLTMYNIPDFENPIILVDGEEDSGDIVSNIVYERDANTITFSTAHFSSFEVAEGNADSEPEVDSVKAKKYFVPNLGLWKVKLKIKGDEFDSGTEVTVGKREPYKIREHGGDEIIAYFTLDKLLNTGKNNLVIRAVNGNETKKFKHQLTSSELTEEYKKLD